MREAAERQLATISSQQGPYAKFIEALIVQVGSYLLLPDLLLRSCPNSCMSGANTTPMHPPLKCFHFCSSCMGWKGKYMAPEVDNWTTKHPCFRTTQYTPSFQLIIILLLVAFSFDVRERERETLPLIKATNSKVSNLESDGAWLQYKVYNILWRLVSFDKSLVRGI
jgi:hypothetical protein